jgi:alkylated DNA nucleotide flippase Atl1
MRYREFTTITKEASSVQSAISAAAPTAISMIAPEFLSKYPQLAKIAGLSPYAAQIVQQLATGQPTQAALTALQNLAPEAGVLPKEINTLLSHWSNTGTMSSVARNLGGKALGASAVLPAALSLPWMMAAEERKKIDADPWNKQYDNNPYAMSVRSGGKITQGQAAAQNQRNAVKTSSTAANPMPGTPEFEKLQQQYAK